MKTKIIFLFLIFVLIFLPNEKLVNSQTGWTQLPAPSNTAHLYGIYFKDILNGITYEYRTTNGGQTWSSFNWSGYAMTFTDPNTGYIVPGIYKTTNFGLNWTMQTAPTGDNLFGVSFPSINTGYACGEGSSIIKTTNGGTNWVLLTPPVSSMYLKGVYFVDANTGYVCGYASGPFTSVIFKTNNGGTNWLVQNFPSGTGYYSIFFVNANTGIVIGEKVAKTTDAGTTWVEKNQSVTTFQHSLFFSSVNTGYSTGFSGNIIKTTDGGETWFQQTSGTGSDLESVYFLDDNTGFVCGDNGVVLKTTDGGGPPIGIKPISYEVPDNFSLYQNYPNPFNPVTKIKFDVTAPLTLPEGGKQANVILKIFDARGREIAVLVNFALSPGSYEVTWEASNYPSGVYFYTLTTNSYKETKRMVLLK